MTKKVILNVVLNLGIILLIMSGVAAYQSGHILFLGLSIALLVVLIYLKMVLLKFVKRDVQDKYGKTTLREHHDLSKSKSTGSKTKKQRKR